MESWRTKLDASASSKARHQPVAYAGGSRPTELCECAPKGVARAGLCLHSNSRLANPRSIQQLSWLTQSFGRMGMGRICESTKRPKGAEHTACTHVQSSVWIIQAYAPCRERLGVSGLSEWQHLKAEQRRAGQGHGSQWRVHVALGGLGEDPDQPAPDGAGGRGFVNSFP